MVSIGHETRKARLRTAAPDQALQTRDSLCARSHGMWAIPLLLVHFLRTYWVPARGLGTHPVSALPCPAFPALLTPGQQEWDNHRYTTHFRH